MADVVGGGGAAGLSTEVDRERGAYADRIRRTNERLAFAVAGLFAITGLSPITTEADRAGVLWTAGLVLVLTVVWFRVVPTSALGDRRVLAFGLLLQPVIAVLLALTAGNDSQYFPYFLLPILVTVYSPRTSHTFVLGGAGALWLVIVAVVTRGRGDAITDVGALTVDLVQLLAMVLFTAFAGRTLREARSAITRRAEVLAVEREEAVREANTDTLTGLYNRRYAEDVLTRLVADGERGRAFSVIAIDVDGLKKVNDTRGHEAGDRLLKRVGETLQLQLRGADLAIRLGGDEFLALLPGTRDVQAQAVAGRLRRAVDTHDWSDVGVAVSISTGVAEWRTGQSGADVVKAADARLYEAKRARPGAPR
jgi:diguanylate cyclase (GGDEF)-like protein